MKRIVKFRLETGESIFIEVDESIFTEVDESSQTDERIGLRDQLDERIGLREQLVGKTTQTFEAALETVKPIANAVITKLGSIKQPADEVEVKFGIKISAQLGAVVASGNSEVNYEITLKWARDSQNDSAP